MLHRAGLAEHRQVAEGNAPQHSDALRGSGEHALRNEVAGRKNMLFAEFAMRMYFIAALLQEE